MKKILSFGFLFVLAFGFGSFTNLYAENDTTPPIGTILINGGALYTNTRNVILTLSATDDLSAVTEMKIANYTSYHDLEPYVTSKNWELTNGDGLKTVRVKFKDQAGNETATGISATITLDTIAPVINLTGLSTINLNVGGTYTELGATVIDADTSVSIIITGPVDTTTAGTYTIRYNASDTAGNKATEVTRTINVTAMPTPVPIHLDIEASDGPIYNQDITVAPCNSDGNGIMKITAYCALAQSNIPSIWSGLWIDSIGGKVNNDNNNGAFWMWLVNLNINNPYSDSICHQDSPFSCSAKEYILNPNEKILFYYNTNPLKISDINLNPAVGSNITISVKKLGLDGWNSVWNPAVGGKIVIGTNTFDLDDNGSYTFTILNTDAFTIKGQLTGFIDTPQIIVTPTTSPDTTPPVISINGISPIDVIKDTVYTDAGATANDAVDGVRTVTTTGNVDATIIGTYTITYTASDTSNNVSTLMRTVNVINPQGNSGSMATGGGGIYVTPTFNIQNALAYLKGVQSSDGSFGGSLMYTDWVAIAFGASSITDSSRDKILAYFSSNNTLSSLLTDNERHTMALLALGQNPYSFNGINYIGAIISSFDGVQFGDANLINDDVFALIPLANSGYTANDDIIAKDVAFIISKQKTDGSWEESVDITSATVQALKPFSSIANVPSALTKATDYLTNKQNNDGGFGDNNLSSVYSTSWAMQEMNALSASWTKGGHTPMDYFGGKQALDGAILPFSEIPQNRIWATSYAIPAVLNKPWSAIMQNVSKPGVQNNASTSVNSELVVVPAPETVKKIDTTPKTKILTEAVSQDVATEPNTSEINSDTLGATAVNALPSKTSSNAIPIALGVGLGIAFLYFAAKNIAK
ncbi:MAG: DUF5011 domain-containing protein [Candidatus Nomurabacteria bacterium]|nr:DUF5011 domain-containing protein [Candidatus Nomurabacteria bacterium]